MPKIKIGYIYFLAVFISTFVLASDERFRTGFVQELSESRIELDMQHTDMISHIGFSCEPEICETTNKYIVGDEVLLTLGSVNNKNKLLAIRKCDTNDTQCDEVKKLDIKEEAERKRQSDISFEKHRQCRDKMNTDLAGKNRYFPEDKSNSIDSDQVLEKYNSMNNQPEHKKCLSSFVKAYRDAVLETCLKHGCGKNIGGGCYHIVGYSVTTSVLGAAIEKCGI